MVTKDKKLKRGCLLLLLLVMFSSCSQKTSNKVGLLLHEMEGRWHADVEHLQKYAAKAGLDLIIKVANGDENKQLMQARELVREGVSVMMIVAVNQNTAAGIVRIAQNAGIKTIAYDRIIQNAELDYFLTYNYEEIGRLQAEYALQKIPAGNYVMLWGDASDNNARQMRTSQEKALKQYINSGDVNLIYRAFIENWSWDNTQKVMQRIVDFSDRKVDVVLASNDNIALAALNVFEKNGMTPPQIITGQDATNLACQSIVKGGQTMTIYKPTDQMAQKAIELVNEVIRGEKASNISSYVNNQRKNIPTLFLTPVVVDKENVLSIIKNEAN